MEIKNIAVDEVYQGRGIGSFLIHKIKKLALEQGMQILRVGIPDSATRQLNFYQLSIKCSIFYDLLANPCLFCKWPVIPDSFIKSTS